MNSLSEKLQKKFSKIPWSIPLIITALCIYGFVILYSAAGGNIHPWAYKQMLVWCIYMPIAFLIALIDIRFIYHNSYVFYLLSIILLLIVEVAGKTAMGATRWIDFGIIRLQPSELTKLSIVLMLAKYFHQLNDYQISKLHSLIIPLTAVLIPAMLIIKQPDLGTGILTILVAASMAFAVGVRIRYFLASGLMVLISIPLIWMSMHTYQKNRVLIFLDPEKEPLGAGYNIVQSKIAIGSGGLTGKGLLSGTQSHLSFLPEYQTDFIFSFLTEELGFLGGIILLILYSLLIIYSLAVAINTRAKFAKLVAVGITSIFFCHVFINIAMVMGMLPVVGVPLPFISYGGTMMASLLIGFGLIMNIGVNQHTNI